jgi:hypothetical protein
MNPNGANLALAGVSRGGSQVYALPALTCQLCAVALSSGARRLRSMPRRGGARPRPKIRASAPQQDDRRPCVAGACQPKAGAPETYWVACRERLHASVAHALRWRHLGNEKGVHPCLLRELPASRPRPPRSPHSRTPCPGPGGDDTNTAPSKPTTSDNPPKNHEDHELQLEVVWIAAPFRTSASRTHRRSA